MIVHIFTANRYHLVPQIIKGFLKNFPKGGHHYLLIGDKTSNFNIYQKIFNEYDYDEYTYLKSFGQLIREFNRFKDHKIILHAGPYYWMLYLILRSKDVNWVCWGSGAKINLNFKSWFFTPLKIFLYRKFHSVGALMIQDTDTLKYDFGLDVVHTLSYFDISDVFPYSEKKLTLDLSISNTIYVGNNSSCLDSYFIIIKKLARFNESLNVLCMANYSFKETEKSNNLKKLGHEIFGNNFTLDTTFYTLEDYYDYMNKCDIYICGVEKQTGLGAIYTALRLGKKVFLSGKNFEWIKTLGCHIYHVNDIEKMNIANFKSHLTIEQKLENYKLITQFLSPEIIKNKWIAFFETPNQNI